MRYSNGNQHRMCLLPRVPEIIQSRVSSTWCSTFVDQIHILNYDILGKKFQLFDFHTMLILRKSEKKFSITSNFAIIVFCKTFYFILIRSFSLSERFFVSVFFQKSIRLNSGGPLLLTSNILSSELTEVAIYRCSKTF